VTTPVSAADAMRTVLSALRISAVMLAVPALANGVATSTSIVSTVSTDAIGYVLSATTPAALVTVTCSLSLGITPPLIRFATPVSTIFVIAAGAELVNCRGAPVADG